MAVAHVTTGIASGFMTNTAGASVATAATLHAVAAGDFIAGACFVTAGSGVRPTVTSVSDTGNGIWTILAQHSDATFDPYALLLGYYKNGLASGATITVNFSGSLSTISAAVLDLDEFSGLYMPTLDQITQAGSWSASTAGVTGTTGATTQANELAVSALCNSNTSSGYTDTAGFTTIATTTNRGVDRVAYKILSATGTVQDTATCSISCNGIGGVVTVGAATPPVGLYPSALGSLGYLGYGS